MSKITFRFNTANVDIALSGGQPFDNTGNGLTYTFDWQENGLELGFIYFFDFTASGFKPLTVPVYAASIFRYVDVTLEAYDYKTGEDWWDNFLKLWSNVLNPSKWVYALRSVFHRFEKGLDDLNDWINNTGKGLNDWVNSVKDKVGKLDDIPALVLSSISHIFIYLTDKYGGQVLELLDGDLSDDDKKEIDTFINSLNNTDSEVLP